MSPTSCQTAPPRNRLKRQDFLLSPIRIDKPAHTANPSGGSAVLPPFQGARSIPRIRSMPSGFWSALETGRAGTSGRLLDIYALTSEAPPPRPSVSEKLPLFPKHRAQSGRARASEHVQAGQSGVQLSG